jgi:hypothetical protein
MLRGVNIIFFAKHTHYSFQRLFIAFSKEDKMNKNHVAKRNSEEPCAVMPASTDLWEPRSEKSPGLPGKHFFLADTKNSLHIIIAKSEESARSIAANSKLEIQYVYELTADTFRDEGFLMTAK